MHSVPAPGVDPEYQDVQVGFRGGSTSRVRGFVCVANCSAGAWNLCQRSQRELIVIVGYAAPVHNKSPARLFRAQQGWARDPAHANPEARAIAQCEHEEVRKEA